MNSLVGLSPQQLRKAADIQEKLLSLQNELDRLLGAPLGVAAAGVPKRRKLSPRAIANIRAGARKRWAKQKGAQGAAKSAHKPKRKISAAGKKRLSELAKARWAKARAAGKARL